MATSEPEPEAPQEASYAGTIVLCGIIALGLTWTYLLFGTSGLGWWAKGGVTIVIFPAMYFAWRWRQQKINRQLEVLQRWADDNDAKTTKRRKPA